MHQVKLPPLCHALRRYGERSALRFHTAGHSGKAFSSSPIPFIRDLYSFCPFDITELSFSDNLLFPQSVIRDSENYIANIYGSYKSLYVTSGTTTSILCVLKAISSLNRTIILSKNNHSSVFNGLEIFDIPHIFVDDDSCNCLTALANTLNFNDNKYCFFYTSPDYFGNIKDSASIYNFCKEQNIYVIVDEAHGSHFNFIDKGLSAIPHADIVLHSAHKTLPALGGSSLIHIINPELTVPVEKYHRKLHTTSPSYIAMATTEYAVCYMENNGKTIYEETINAITAFKNKLTRLSIVEPIENCDPTRLVLLSKAMDGDSLAKKLEEKNAFAEMNTIDKVVFIITPFNYCELDKLFIALDGIEKTLMCNNDTSIFSENIVEEIELLVDGNENNIEEIDLLAELKESNIEKIKNIDLVVAQLRKKITAAKIDLLVGRLCKENIYIYPPSTPIALKGERITQTMIDAIKTNLARVIGLKENLN